MGHRVALCVLGVAALAGCSPSPAPPPVDPGTGSAAQAPVQQVHGERLSDAGRNAGDRTGSALNRR